MNIEVILKPNSKLCKVEKISRNNYKVSVKSPAKEGKANEEAIKVLSDYFNIPKSDICLAKGGKSRTKIFKLEGMIKRPTEAV